MKSYKYIALMLVSLVMAVGCHEVLDIEPQDKITAQDLFSDPAGTELYMADLYYRLPMEDLNYYAKNNRGGGFEVNYGGPNNAGEVQAMLTPWAVHSRRNIFIDGNRLKWWKVEDSEVNDNKKDASFTPWTLIRNVNAFIEIVPDLPVDDQTKTQYNGEAHFIRAFAYFGLAKRYGGVPIITESQDFEGDPEALLVARNTEQETWDFILSECDMAATNLEGIDDPNYRRATKWAALALKSRVALYAASVAKFDDKLDLVGPAVDQGLVGIPSSAAGGYYQQCIDAGEELINSGQFSLYQANPASAEEAAENYRAMFENPNLAMGTEAILIKGKSSAGDYLANNYDIWFNPHQTRNGWPHPGRYCPTLDLVDMYESYTSGGTSAPLVTTSDGDVSNYLGYDPARDYLKFDHPMDIFQGKDARLFGSVILPGMEWKGVEIVYQNGFIKPDGEFVTDTQDSYELDGVTYYTYGAETSAGYSGFDPTGENHSATGFGLKKFLSLDPVVPAWNQSFTDFMELRYAEVLLDYAEAYAESGLGTPETAGMALNALRQRAGHTNTIAVTVETVKRERLVELAFENKGYWDLIRRREFHEQFDDRNKHALVPVLDLRENPPKHIFVRKEVSSTTSQTFRHREYYRPIDNIGLNQLMQNPEW
ncbi:RagB/SusD family nutrient uptake outer membrane protein [Reichenbachiella ulvae]|uniref:RagB/SusD family nutrient uptake outer membrane protein n=1 Tax=Reichenbachiella ulvae TaxID=2980104 RepID=A0ABT3CNY7_9BACT|nr:RagB/SusD family nutrient uptake outer membrane protein [Reichenbachiella ulvae]MCV9385253.1 RagB/SusD family nutrient uptake outer membrane protein [Reichenbachiella ulvae]